MRTDPSNPSKRVGAHPPQPPSPRKDLRSLTYESDEAREAALKGLADASRWSAVEGTRTLKNCKVEQRHAASRREKRTNDVALEQFRANKKHYSG